MSEEIIEQSEIKPEVQQNSGGNEKSPMPEYDQVLVSFQINKKTEERECKVLEILREKVKIRDEQANADNELVDHKSIGHAKVWLKSGTKKEGDIIE